VQHGWSIDTRTLEHWRPEYDLRDRLVRDLGLNSYDAYRLSEGYRQRRAKALDASGGICEHCNERNPLEVHHRTYERLGNEMPWDLIALCRTCHDVAHGRLPPEEAGHNTSTAAA
jgi:5-methylcytosine-specific restriction endonuclease McrA